MDKSMTFPYALIILPKGTSCTNTRRIFDILQMNQASQHAFEAAQPVECCNTVSAKQIEI